MVKRVAVLRGGPSVEHDVSLTSGAQVLRELEHNTALGFQPVDVFIDRVGQWHVRGVPMEPERALRHIDVVWNALHGTYGEDGTVQRILDRLGMSYTGSSAYASSVSMNKLAAKQVLAQAGIKTPLSLTMSVSSTLEHDIVGAFRKLLLPVVIKPAGSGSSFGVSMARTFHEFEQGIKDAFSFSPQVLIEEYVAGKEATCGVVEGFRTTPLYSLPPIEVVLPPTERIFSAALKLNEADCSRCPGSFTAHEAQELRRSAEVVHAHLGLRHYSRSDFIVSPRGVYFLEVNTSPGLAERSLFPQGISAVGASFSEFVEHVLGLALKKR